MYTEKVMDHFAHPRNMGEIKDANGVGMVGNAKCGDIMQMFLKVNDDGIIEDVPPLWKLWKVFPPQSFIAPFLRKKLLKRLSITTMPAKKAEPTANATAFPAATTMSMITIMNMKKMPRTDF